jgi:hypothetical protein
VPGRRRWFRRFGCAGSRTPASVVGQADSLDFFAHERPASLELRSDGLYRRPAGAEQRPSPERHLKPPLQFVVPEEPRHEMAGVFHVVVTLGEPVGLRVVLAQIHPFADLTGDHDHRGLDIVDIGSIRIQAADAKRILTLADAYEGYEEPGCARCVPVALDETDAKTKPTPRGALGLRDSGSKTPARQAAPPGAGMRGSSVG